MRKHLLVDGLPKVERSAAFFDELILQPGRFPLAELFVLWLLKGVLRGLVTCFRYRVNSLISQSSIFLFVLMNSLF